MSVVAFIFARGGSKGLPGKNIRLFNGKPLIAWSIEQALSVKKIDKVYVSTDSKEIAKIATSYGAEVPFLRPAEFSLDNSSEWSAWRHALNFMNEKFGNLPNLMVSIPSTAPLRLAIDIENCIEEFNKGSVDIVITTTNSHRNPYFNMIKKNEDGTVSLAISGASSINRRQDVPEVYDMTTVCYAAKPEFVLSHNSIFEGRVKSVHVPIERAIDIDSLLDFQMAEYLFNTRDQR